MQRKEKKLVFFRLRKVNAGTLMTKAYFDGFKFAESMYTVITLLIAKRLDSC